MKQDIEKKQLLNDNDPAFGTYISNETEISSDTERLLRNSKQSRNKKSSFLPADTILQKKLITLRSTLLALSLTLTLFVFWLLDSLKDPVFATLVDGNLKKHQPLAKMASVGSTLVLVLFMEFISHEKDKRIRNEDVEILSKDEVLSGGGIWTRMNVGSSEIDGMISHTTDSEDSGQIPFAVFKVVGICYTIAFCLISYILRQHHSFSNILIPDMDQSDHTAWYILGYLQYITIESFGSIGVATFWSFTNSSLSLRAAKSYYGFIIACAQLGAIGGSTVATSSISIPNLFVFACFGIASQMIVMHIYGIYFPQPMSEEDDRALSHIPSQKNDYEFELSKTGKKVKKSDHPIDRDESMSFISGVYLILRHNYLILILGVSCLYEISLTCLDYEMKLIGLERFSSPPELVEDSSKVFSDNDASAFATFMGRYGQLTNVLSLLISYYAFPYLIENHGLKNTLRIFPSLLVLVTVTTFVALPMNLPVLFVSMSLLKALTYSINDPAKEILYIPTSNAVKFKAKFWIDVVGARVAKAIGSSINTYAGTAERIVTYGSLPSVITAVTLWLVCFSVGMEFDRLLVTGEIIGCEEEYERCHSYDNIDGKEEDALCSEASYDYDESMCESHVSIELIQHNR